MSTIGRLLYAMRRQSFMQLSLVVVLLGSWVRPSLAQEAFTKLLVAHAGLISTHASVWLAEDQGFYKKHGLDVTSVFTGSGSVTSQALIAGEAKVASTSVGPTAGAVGAGADLMIVAGTIHIMPYQFWVLPQVRQPADLKGKRVAISTFGSGSHLAAEVALQVLGLKLDAPYLNTVIVVSRRYAKENPQIIESFLKGTIDGLAFLPNPANERAVKSVLARRLKLTTPQSIQVMYDTTLEIHAKTKIPNAPVAGVQNMIDVLLRINPRLAKLKAADLIDSSFIERLEKSGYIKEAMKRSG